MISATLMGGLGNYLFQIGAAATLAHKNNDEACFDYSLQIQVHKDIHSYSSNILRNVRNVPVVCTHVYTEPGDFAFNEIPYVPNLRLHGYFQTEKHLDRDYILELFSIDGATDDYITAKYSHLLELPELVSVHVRRGDYIEKQDRHPVQGLDYYQRAFEQFPNAKFAIFSDGMDWCKEHFIGDRFAFIENEFDFIDLYLMSKCHHNIIANSSFSWWGAYLNTYQNKKVIAPSVWFGNTKKLITDNIYCNSWIVL